MIGEIGNFRIKQNDEKTTTYITLLAYDWVWAG